MTKTLSTLERRMAESLPPEKNGKGLTWSEWWRAAGISPDGVRGAYALDLLAAWRRGEDPGEHAAASCTTVARAPGSRA